MLNITLKRGQRVRVTIEGVTLWIRLEETRAGRAALSFDGPREARVVREEVLKKAAGKAV